MRTLLIVFSGTGNSFYIAKKFQQQIEDTDIIILNKDTALQNIQQYDKIGIIAPLYYYKLPLIVNSFIRVISLPENKYYFTIITRGVFPEGGALSQMRNIFRSKNIVLNYACYITMPLNDITFFKPQKKEIQLDIINNANKRIELISRDIIAKKQKKDFEPLKLISSLISSLFFNNPHIMDQYFNVDKALCTKCGQCESYCPVYNIKLSNFPIWNKNCEVCLRCYHYCPTHAIKYKNITSQVHNYTNPYVSISELIGKNKT